MAAICYSDSIWTISSEIAPLPEAITYAKLFEEISSNEKAFHTSTWFRSFSLYGSYMLLCCDIDGTAHMSSFKWKKERVQNFRSISPKLTNEFAYIQTDSDTWLNRHRSSPWSFMYMYILENLRYFLLGVTNYFEHFY